MKRIISLAVCLALSVSLFAGCGKDSGASSETSAGASAVASTSGSDAASSGEVKFPLSTQVTFKMTVKTPRLASPFGEMEFFKQIERDTNVHIEWNNINEDQYDQKKALLLASNDLPDAFYMGGFTDQEIMNAAKVGTFIPLDSYIDKTKYLKAILEKRPDAKKYITNPDGKIYSLASINELAFTNGNDPISIFSAKHMYFLNKKWMDKLGLKEPETVDELHTVLKGFKENDPNGNGKKDEVPLTFVPDTFCGDLGGLMNAFGLGDNEEHRQIVNGKVVYTAASSQYKTAMETFGQWYKEGLIDPESFTYKQKVDAYLAKGKNPDYTVGSFVWWEIPEYVGADRKDDYITLKPLKNTDGTQTYYRNQAEPVDKKGTFSITKACKDPATLMAWVDRFYEPKLSAQAQYGPIGIMFDEKDGKLVNKTLPEGTNAGEYRQKVAPGSGAPSALLSEDYDSLVDMDPRARLRLDDIKKYFFPYFNKEYWKPCAYTEEELKTINECEQPLKDYVTQMRAEFITKGNVDEKWDSYVSQLEKLGMSKIVKAWQDAEDRTYGSK